MPSPRRRLRARCRRHSTPGTCRRGRRCWPDCDSRTSVPTTISPTRRRCNCRTRAARAANILRGSVWLQLRTWMTPLVARLLSCWVSEPQQPRNSATQQLLRFRFFLRLRRPHVAASAEARAFGDDDLRRLDVAVDGGGGHELDAVVGGDV